MYNMSDFQWDTSNIKHVVHDYPVRDNSISEIESVFAEIFMLKTSKKSNKKVVAVIKNEHTKAQMSQLDDEFANHTGPYLTLAEVIAIETEKQKQPKS